MAAATFASNQTHEFFRAPASGKQPVTAMHQWPQAASLQQGASIDPDIPAKALRHASTPVTLRRTPLDSRLRGNDVILDSSIGLIAASIEVLNRELIKTPVRAEPVEALGAKLLFQRSHPTLRQAQGERWGLLEVPNRQSQVSARLSRPKRHERRTSARVFRLCR
jgi:hypothetical protein